MAERKRTLLAHLIRESEKAIILQYLRRHSGNKSRAAEALGVSHRHLQRRCVALGISGGDVAAGGVGVVIVGGLV